MEGTKIEIKYLIDTVIWEEGRASSFFECCLREPVATDPDQTALWAR